MTVQQLIERLQALYEGAIRDIDKQYMHSLLLAATRGEIVGYMKDDTLVITGMPHADPPPQP